MIIRPFLLVGGIVGLLGGVTLASVPDRAVDDRTREARAAYTQGERSAPIPDESRMASPQKRPTAPRPEAVRAPTPGGGPLPRPPGRSLAYQQPVPGVEVEPVRTHVAAHGDVELLGQRDRHLGR